MKYADRLFGHNLKRLRKGARKSQQDIANLFDSDPVTVSRWETGAMGIDPKKVQTLCEYFKIEESEFYNPIEAGTGRMSDLADSQKLAEMAAEIALKRQREERVNLSQAEWIDELPESVLEALKSAKWDSKGTLERAVVIAINGEDPMRARKTLKKTDSKK